MKKIIPQNKNILKMRVISNQSELKKTLKCNGSNLDNVSSNCSTELFKQKQIEKLRLINEFKMI